MTHGAHHHFRCVDSFLAVRPQAGRGTRACGRVVAVTGALTGYAGGGVHIRSKLGYARARGMVGPYRYDEPVLEAWPRARAQANPCKRLLATHVHCDASGYMCSRRAAMYAQPSLNPRGADVNGSVFDVGGGTHALRCWPRTPATHQAGNLAMHLDGNGAPATVSDAYRPPKP